MRNYFRQRGRRGVRTPLMTRLCLVLDFAFLGCTVGWVVWWPTLGPVDRGPRVELPLLDTWWDGHEEPDRSITVSITKEGGVYVGETPATPDRLRLRFEEAVRTHASTMRSRGQPLFEGHSRLGLTLRADRAASWGAVRRVMQSAGKSGIYKIRFLASVRDRVWNRSRTRPIVTTSL